MNKRQQSAENTKKKLIQAALKLLKENGLNSINVEEITKEAGVAKGTFYVYFKRKEDIIAEYSRYPFKEISDELKKMQNTNLIDKLTHYFYRFMQCVETPGINICREWIKAVIDPNNTQNSQDSEKWVYDFEMLKEILVNAIQNYELKPNTPVELLSHLIISQLYGMMTCWCMSDGKFEPLEWSNKFCELQLKSILKEYLI
ncbi:MAG: TetR/AcrR family transcriptional regulator [Clostridium sp.]|nr:TetR/AcrR family transcriptional regulator [Clostridium sp.]